MVEAGINLRSKARLNYYQDLLSRRRSLGKTDETTNKMNKIGIEFISQILIGIDIGFGICLFVLANELIIKNLYYLI